MIRETPTHLQLVLLYSPWNSRTRSNSSAIPVIFSAFKIPEIVARGYSGLSCERLAAGRQHHDEPADCGPLCASPASYVSVDEMMHF
jgi:hypothetical protein